MIIIVQQPSSQSLSPDAPARRVRTSASRRRLGIPMLSDYHYHLRLFYCRLHCSHHHFSKGYDFLLRLPCRYSWPVTALHGDTARLHSSTPRACPLCVGWRCGRWLFGGRRCGGGCRMCSDHHQHRKKKETKEWAVRLRFAHGAAPWSLLRMTMMVAVMVGE